MKNTALTYRRMKNISIEIEVVDYGPSKLI